MIFSFPLSFISDLRYDCTIVCFFHQYLTVQKKGLEKGLVFIRCCDRIKCKQNDGSESMKTVVPDYYPAFRCKADKCEHTCCAGWEIDIDDDTYTYYKSIGGRMGEKLMNAISADSIPHFILEGEDERCPMLDKNGLCALITEFGEGALCQICADHPRFRNYYSDRTETGLGLCCEAAGGLILGNKDKVKLLTLADDGETEPLTEEERALFDLRSRMTVFLQDRRFPVHERMENVLALCHLKDTRSIKELAGIFLSLERLDETWTQRLLKLAGTDGKTIDRTDECGQTILEQFAVCLVFRHTPYLKNPKAVLSISGMVRIFEALCAEEKRRSGETKLLSAVETARLLSSEVEYSDENIEQLFR